ncbi:phage tail protein [Bacillus sp. S70]|uniref:phage tail spike protein n=1 Tax=unclassified Bacillus (in: firmicutes) TaxID=185979 RepID=UPI00190CF86D|nr:MULTISPECIES: phage tail spike protein [unclassified Bacillus (in: firmicutes)]MBJ9983592.1 phage tail protein [Bacillus sp. S29]MBK0104747.1 phage tail protein [Bacillus sp. S70]MBK0110008.1 phage tail protein [Bacillus sp. S73]MBK0138874.1 phage tail protein [Bacillus sp. S72]MBK0147979.1 phage tail protein [Bacillus sp. S74]
MQLKAYLENAYKIKYNPPLNELWTAGFSLPFTDPKREEIETFDYVEIFDNGKRIGMFRIMDSDEERDAEKKIISYECEHVLSTLMDSVLFGLHQRVNLTTRQNIEYLLSKQRTQHWKLGQCDFVRYFHYNWENESTLLGPLYSIPKPFDEKFQWTWDDSSYPWTLNLVRYSTEVTGELRFKKNMKGIKRTVEAKEVMTRIYPLGYGEGVNQLTIKDVNNGVPYIDAPDFVRELYDGFDYIWVDRRFKDPQSLYDSANTMLIKACMPKITYEIEAVDYELIDPYKIEKYETGKLVRLYDEDFDIWVDLRVVNHSKDDADGNPLDVKLTLENKVTDLGTIQADIEKRQKINEVYAQGSTNILNYSYNDNCDSENPAVIKFYLPDDLVNINTLDLTFETDEFRAYSKATKGGGAIVQSTGGGGAIVSSTEAGGGTVQSTGGGGGTVQSTGGGGATVGTSSSGGGVSKSTESGGGSTQTSSAGGGTTQTTASKIFGELIIESDKPTPFTDLNLHVHVIKFTDQFDHHHEITIGPHTHQVLIPVHSHDFSVPAHSHQITLSDHTHQIVLQDHVHQIVLQDHVHKIELKDHVHEIVLPDHVHEVEHGIYRLSRKPSKVIIKVDGNVVPITETSKENIDLIPYLAKDTDGKINRGRWVEITITPDDLGRVNANVISRLFISSAIGGTF